VTNAVDHALAVLRSNSVVARIWRGDNTVWGPQPNEILDRLGWLNVDQAMLKNVAALRGFAARAVEDGAHHVVLLGMGGSSLGPEVLASTFEPAPGFPRLLVLDSTVPAAISAVRSAIDPRHTLFLVSSKSGGTIETMSLYRYFRAEVEALVGDDAGAHFVAITDAGTSLDRLAVEARFRHSFQNPADIGGRYSVLSYFGLVPASLLGIDLRKFLERAAAARAACTEELPDRNPGASLGATIGAMALAGRDKLTIVTSPALAALGLWIEQLVAESTGKIGTGIIPVASEPLCGPEAYGGDRLFVYLHLESDADAETSEAIARLEQAGHPAVRIVLSDRYDLAGEFFRWEFAVAVASNLLGINPFDQPDVQSAKDQSDAMLKEFERSGTLPVAPTMGSLSQLLESAVPGDYLAITAFIRQTPETDAALGRLRRKLMERHRIATTVGYGPRFLHSTGQLHKGGKPNGLFLQLTAPHNPDLRLPGRPYTFGTLADAQALGDLQALQARGRRVCRVLLSQDVPGDIARLADSPGSG
jgi:glucose-6-phosphate isomerase/transaldolase/glucose-6-phosphate isomerase